MSANNNKTAEETKLSQIDRLVKPVIPVDPIGAIYRITTTKLADHAVDLINNTLGIEELDHIFISPEFDENGKIADFIAAAGFNTSRNTKEWSIRRLGKSSAGNNNSKDGRIDLLPFLGSRTSTGGFEMSGRFKEVFGAIAETNNNGDITVKAGERDPRMAIVDLDFFKLVGLCFGVQQKDNFDFSIEQCRAVRNESSNTEYVLEVKKYISHNNSSRGKSGMDYTAMDQQYRRKANRR